ncbi:EMB506 protein [Hibiscus syriacus]|uniref:EMB506 protein n=1 Tax=Hibiscus syriacus TaxID=106335 RepID=A0A6A3AS16_HIBSY|nr:ankyrin repeat domain-containing protein EMB506, chloroplastic-like [Hibiscus syriacus]KAE8706718.1 EMB506 protein [Hibiscus syriacus]
MKEMATVSALSTPLRLISKTHFKSPEYLSFYPNSILFQTKVCSFSSNSLSLSSIKTKTLYGAWKLKSAEEGETVVSEQEEPAVAEQQDSVSVPLSHSDTHITYFQADGMWEDPDDGSASEYEDDDDNYVEEEMEKEDYGSGFQQGNPVGVIDNYTTNQYEEDLIKEVEQLLGPEEKAILQQNASPNLRKILTAKWKPLQTLALSLQIHSMDKLLEDGLNIDEVDKDGHTALHKAIIGKKEAVISHLLRKGANPHVKDKDGATPLHYAVHVGALQTVKLLLKYDVDVNVADRDGWTPLHIAVQSRNRDIAKVLLINGADKTRKNKDGKTALDISLCYGKDFKSYDLAKLLKILPAESYL